MRVDIPADPNAGLGPATILRANALDLPLPDASVDLVVTSPPYFALRSYRDGGEHFDGQIGDEPTSEAYLDALIAATREMVRVLKPTGSIWVNLGDKYAQDVELSRNGQGKRKITQSGGLVGTPGYLGHTTVRLGRRQNVVPRKSLIGLPWRYAIRCIDELGLILRAEVIWAKPNGLPESVTDRVRRSHETWFHFVTQPRYFAAVDEIREPHVWGREINPAWRETRRQRIEAIEGRETKGGRMATMHPLGRLPGSVRTVATTPLRVPEWLGVDHFAAFPPAWPAWVIRGWCPKGGVVLDPFGGTGTTALAARALGRHGITVDLSADYCRLAQWRVTDPDQLAKVTGRRPRRKRDHDNHDGVIDGQVSLLDLIDDGVAS